MSHLDGLLDRAKWSTLTSEEIAYVADKLADRPLTEDTYTLLHILGHAAGPEYQNLVTAYLECHDDPPVASLALRILCDYWGLARQYRQELIRALEKVEWDVDDDVRDAAISITGDFLQDADDRELAQHLIRIVKDETEEMDRREWSLRALGRALGLSHNELPGLGVSLTSDKGRAILGDSMLKWG